MTIRIGEIACDGPYACIDSLDDEPGVYMILARRGDATYTPVDAGEADDVYHSVADRDEAIGGGYHYAVLYTGAIQPAARRAIVQSIRRCCAIE